MRHRLVSTALCAFGVLVATAVPASVATAASASDPELPPTPSPFVPASPTPSNAQLAGMSHTQLAHALVRCQQIQGETYCLQAGFTDEDVTSSAFWQDIERIASEAPSVTGEMSLGDRLDQLAAMTATDRQNAEDEETTEAAAAVGAYKLLEYRSLGQEPPMSFWAEYPDLQISDAAARADGGAALWSAAMDAQQQPVEYKIMPDSAARRQVDDDWCGPATMQMIDGGDPKDTNGFDSQASWAADLGTTSQGTWIGALRQQINAKTSWDSRGGRYTIVRVGSWTRDRYWAAITHQIGYLGAPYVLHPKLAKATHPYLSTSGTYGGHFEPGRGYQRTSDGQRFVMIFEPFNEPDWTAYTQRTWGLRHVKVADALAADKENQGNIAI